MEKRKYLAPTGVRGPDRPTKQTTLSWHPRYDAVKMNLIETGSDVSETRVVQDKV
jgi:hypothetical protein